MAAAPHGPLALSETDNGLGGLALPQRIALDQEGTLYLLGPDMPWIKRFDAQTRGFVPLPEVGGSGPEARQFREPQNIAVAGANLYVADWGNRRVQVFDLASLALRHVWGPWNAEGQPVTVDAPDVWEPRDVSAQAGVAYILDRRYGRVYRHQPGTDGLHRVIDAPAAANSWLRVIVDRDGRLYLLRPEDVSRLDIYDAQGRRVGEVTEAGDVRDRFDAPALRLDHQGRFCLPESLLQPCNRRVPPTPPAPEAPLALCPPQTEGGMLFDRHGNRAQVKAAEPSGPPPYFKKGRLFSQALDSQIYRCQWHRIELTLDALPAGTQVEVSTYTAEASGAEAIQDLPDHLWDTRYVVTGQMQPAPNTPSGAQHEFLVQSLKGQYLWLRLQLCGDGYATPAVRAIRVHYPRESYLTYLPAVYTADDESAWFLERFLSIFQTEWDGLEREIEDIARYFDPAAVPAGPFLAYLARWLALPLEGAWNEAQKRRLLVAMPALYSRRGTLNGLRDYLRVYLQNIVDCAPEDTTEYPQIIEGFRERQRLLLAVDNLADLSHGAPLWSPSVVGRLQLGVFAREGEVRLVSTGDPERELFHEYAHRFQVFMPAQWIRTAENERMVRRALDTEKPAHTHYDLCLVEPRFRVGLQSTLGLDTIIGDYPVARLACLHDTDAPPSRPARHRLGYDTILSAPPARGPHVHLTPGTRVGMDTLLI
jgi:phage tail-like protein